MNDINPQTYLDDVITRIVNRHPLSHIDELLPFAYVSTAPQRAVACKQRLLSDQVNHAKSAGKRTISTAC